MSQIDLNGQPEPTPPDERLWVKLQRMHTNGYYEVKQNAQQLLDEGYFSDEWLSRVTINAAVKAVEDVLRGRKSDGTRRAIKTSEVHQYRLWEWATFDESVGHIGMLVGQYKRDGAAITIDAGALIRKFPRKKKQVLAILPRELWPMEK